MPTVAEESLHCLLRQATASAHQALEDTLQLLQAPQRDRLLAVLAGFHGFHRVWEPALATALGATAFVQQRQRLAALEHDLQALGMAPARIAQLPRCSEAAVLCADHDAALGSLYVMEGSTLGGKVIARHLDRHGGAAWLPVGGLRYFDPVGLPTAARWRETLAYIEDTACDRDRVVEGALRTFAMLRGWLPAATPTALHPHPAPAGAAA